MRRVGRDSVVLTARTHRSVADENGSPTVGRGHRIGRAACPDHSRAPFGGRRERFAGRRARPPISGRTAPSRS
ncbi:MAG TPA: hypothetical protein VII33_18660, partial [Nakamurella sp.]